MIPELNAAYIALVRERTRIDDVIRTIKPLIPELGEPQEEVDAETTPMLDHITARLTKLESISHPPEAPTDELTARIEALEREYVARLDGAKANGAPGAEAPAKAPIKSVREIREARIIRILNEGPAVGLTCKEIAREFCTPEDRNDNEAVKRQINAIWEPLQGLVESKAIVKDSRLYRRKEEE